MNLMRLLTFPILLHNFMGVPLGLPGRPPWATWTNSIYQFSKLLKNKRIYDNVEFPTEIKPQFPLDSPHGFELPICIAD